MASEKRVVVIGGGMAAARFTARLGGGLSTHLTVTVLGEERHPPYNRVLLADVLAGRYAPEVAALPQPPYAHRLHGVRAVRVDRGARVVLCDDGSAVPYDVLVLATGSSPVLPPLRGLFGGGTGFDRAGRELPDGVRAFRTMDDCLALARAVREGTRAVVVGGGPLGVLAARVLAQRGARVVLAHQGEHLLDRHLDPGAAAVLRRHLEELGVEVHTECRVRGLRTDGEPAAGQRAVRAVVLADGYALDCELTVLACGVRPRTGLARAAGLAVERGVVVDDQLRTSDPRIFAIGDCAEHDGVLYGLAGAAQEQADTLASVLAPGSAPVLTADGAPAGRTSRPAPPPRYTGTRALTRLTLAPMPAPARAPLDLAAFGETVPRPDDDVVHLADATRGVYRKVIVRGDRLVGGILLGDLGTVGVLARTWEDDEPLPATPLFHLLTNDGGH